MNKNRHIDIMGIVNLTDDSFYAASRSLTTRAALDRIWVMLEEGASIIDLGACSTRPGSRPVGAMKEWERLLPVLSSIKKEYPEATISIDTYWAEVVSRAYDLIGDFIVNDISSGAADPLMLQTVGKLGLRYVAMHMRGTPETMQNYTDYEDVISDVLTFFKDFAQKAAENGINDWILDPGFGFAKSIGQNYELLSRLDELKSLSRPVLVGISRKSMIYKLLGIKPEDSLPATQVLHLRTLQLGADILRVHDVGEAMRTLSLYRAL